MSEEILTDSQVIEQILSTDSLKREFAIRYLYFNAQIRKAFKDSLTSYGATETEIEEVFDTALIEFDRYVREGRFNQEAQIAPYLLAIGKAHFFSKRRSESRRKDEEQLFANQQETVDYNSIEDAIIIDEKTKALTKALESMGEKCREILRMWALGISMETIANEMGLSNAATAKKQAYRCRERLSAFIRANPHLLTSLRACLKIS